MRPTEARQQMEAYGLTFQDVADAFSNRPPAAAIRLDFEKSELPEAVGKAVFKVAHRARQKKLLRLTGALQSVQAQIANAEAILAKAIKAKGYGVASAGGNQGIAPVLAEEEKVLDALDELSAEALDAGDGGIVEEVGLIVDEYHRRSSNGPNGGDNHA